MKLKLHTLFVFLIFSLASSSLSAQLFIDTSYTAEEMVLDFFDNTCVTPTNITYTGGLGTYGFFDAGNTNLGVNAGIYLGTGLALEAIGPNDQTGASGNSGSPGDMDLDALISFPTNDAAVLEMDIVATGNQLDFSYVFGSEEYPEWVNSGFNDVFAFFISGPGITGLQNIAMVPGAIDPVSVNTINEGLNSQYYVDNTGGMDLQFDGYTTELNASVTVTANETYHIKIAIADASDNVIDSGIFLGIESLCGMELLTPPALFNVSVDNMQTSFENTSKYATSYFWDFGDNTTSTDRNPEMHTYAADGDYEVTLITQNYCCSDTMTAQITIGDPTGIEDLDQKPFKFSPNPVSDFAQITFENGAAFEVRIFDAAGHLIAQKNGNGNLELGFQGYTKGVYILEVVSEGKIYRDKFLKL